MQKCLRHRHSIIRNKTKSNIWQIADECEKSQFIGYFCIYSLLKIIFFTFLLNFRSIFTQCLFRLKGVYLNYGETLSNLPAAIASVPNKYIERTMHLTDKRYAPLCEHTEKVGKITFVVSSFADSTAEKKPEQLILQLLENKINEEKMEESA